VRTQSVMSLLGMQGCAVTRIEHPQRKGRSAVIVHLGRTGRGYRCGAVAHCPSVQIIYDTFPVIRHRRNALHAIRKAELDTAVSRFKGMVASQQFILFSRQAHVRGKAQTALHDILGANRTRLTAHRLHSSIRNPPFKTSAPALPNPTSRPPLPPGTRAPSGEVDTTLLHP
jgi:hypothetical protein